MDERLTTTGEHRAAGETQERILNAARQVYAEAGFRGTTTRRVAQAAGVNEVTLFRHFGTKEALVKAALSGNYPASSNATLEEPVDPPAELLVWTTAVFEHWYASRHLISKVLGDLAEHPELAPEMCDEPGSEHQMLSRYFVRMRELGMTTNEFHPDAVAGMLTGGIFSHAIWRDFTTMIVLPPHQEVMRHFVGLMLAAVGYQAPVARSRKEKS